MLYDYIYIKSKLCRYGIKVLSKMGACGTQKKFISKAGIFMILRKEENSQPTIKPNFISGSLIPYLHCHVKYFLNRDSGNSFFSPVHSLQKKNSLTTD